MTLAQKMLLALTVATCLISATATLLLMPSHEEQWGVNWGDDVYVGAQLPYLGMVILAILFRKTVAGASISLIGAVVIGVLGLFAWYAMPPADAAFAGPVLLAVGCGVVLLGSCPFYAQGRAWRDRGGSQV